MPARPADQYRSAVSLPDSVPGPAPTATPRDQLAGSHHAGAWPPSAPEWAAVRDAFRRTPDVVLRVRHLDLVHAGLALLAGQASQTDAGLELALQGLALQQESPPQSLAADRQPLRSTRWASNPRLPQLRDSSAQNPVAVLQSEAFRRANPVARTFRPRLSNSPILCLSMVGPREPWPQELGFHRCCGQSPRREYSAPK